VDFKLQIQPPHTFKCKADRNGVLVEATVAATPDASWGVPWTGLTFGRQTEEHKATGVFDALGLGGRRTVRSVKQVYQNLSGMMMGRISPLTMSGPITLAEQSYLLAGEDFWTLLLFLGLISVNLAVVNFLPIPVLDGGHMVFLLYEAVFRRPAPVWVQNWLTLIGLVMVLCLMVFTIGLDVYKKFFMG
jgi:regulator of sigma E protease